MYPLATPLRLSYSNVSYVYSWPPRPAPGARRSWSRRPWSITLGLQGVQRICLASFAPHPSNPALLPFSRMDGANLSETNILTECCVSIFFFFDCAFACAVHNACRYHGRDKHLQLKWRSFLSLYLLNLVKCKYGMIGVRCLLSKLRSLLAVVTFSLSIPLGLCKHTWEL